MSYKLDSFTRILRTAAQAEATELCFKVPNRPLFRIQGQLVPTEEPELSPRDTQELAFTLASLAQTEIPVSTLSQQEFSFGVHGIGRFRASVYRQRGTISIVVQIVPLVPPSLIELGMDPELERLVGQHGLMLIAGDRRKDALAAIINGYNASHRGHVVVLERSLSYLYRDAMASISHREVGSDVESFNSGILHASSIGADVLAVVDVEDTDTIDAALTAAETAVPTILTVNAPDADNATWWLMRRFFGQQRDDTDRRITALLHTIVSVSTRTGYELHSVFANDTNE